MVPQLGPTIAVFVSEDVMNPFVRINPPTNGKKGSVVVDFPSIDDYMHGRPLMIPTHERILAAAEALGVSEGWVLIGEDEDGLQLAWREGEGWVPIHS